MRSKQIILVATLLAIATIGKAQTSSTMTDDQVMSYVVSEHAKGTSNAQIVTQLMQQGVDISQIRRVRSAYEQSKKASVGAASSATTASQPAVRSLRTAKKKDTGDDTQQATLPNPGQTTMAYDTNAEYDRTAGFGSILDVSPDDTATIVSLWNAERQEMKKPKVFGRDIFNNQQLSFEPNMNLATPQSYRLGPGDAVNIDIYGASQKNLQATVSADGTITVPGYGPVGVSGMTVSQANNHLRATLGRRYTSSKIRLTVGETKTIMVNVMGEVKIPGTYTLSAFATVFHALYMAGGTNDLGTLRNIKVYRNNRLVTQVDIYDYILNGKLTGNVRLADNDVIVVGPYDCLVNIQGKVKRPMIYEMKRSESLGTLLKYAGGFTGDAYKKSVHVDRKTGRERAAYNVEEFDFASFRMDDCDSVSVDSILPRYANTVEVKGAVFRPGMYDLGEQVNSVRTLVEHAEGLTEEAFTSRAVMHRMKTDRTLEVLSVDIGGIMGGTTPDIPLRQNDVLFIPTRQERTTERTITISGEVNNPGTYLYADNETIEDFVLQAGGLTDQASVINVMVSRRVNDPKALRPDSVIARTYTMNLKDGFVVDGEPGFKLMPYDEVMIRKSPAYEEQQNVSVEGEVMFGGTYTLARRNTRLSDLYRMAGGATDMAYLKGARVIRRANDAEKERMEAVLKMQKEQMQKNILQIAASSSNAQGVTQASKEAGQAGLEKFKVPEEYAVGIDLTEALKNPGCDADIILRDGDRLVIPQYNGTVKINGAVMYANTVAYEKGKRASYYIDQAGGFASDAQKSKVYVIYMNGKVAKLSHGAKVQPGCEIVVPAKLSRKMSPAEYMSLGSSMSSLAAMIATVANLTK